MSEQLNVGVFIYPKVTMLDAYAPHQIFSYVDQFNTFLFAKDKEPLVSDSGAILTANYGFADCPSIDILVVAGAADTLDTLKDRKTIDFIRKAGRNAKYVTSVCTGSLFLAEAGLLDGYRAATHWGWKDCLECYPNVTVVDERVTIDGNRITGGGITAGLDFAFTVISEVVNEDVAQVLQLIFQYSPEPPFAAGLPETTPEHIRQMVDPIVAQLKSNGIVEYCQKNNERLAS
ncbi:MAG TPA: DJ-1/PfpI family protein [Gammaproteobacteria bacterium]|nr:DJ-1/PfpI family protein [Gammaproteobacteria bacterium]